MRARAAALIGGFALPLVLGIAVAGMSMESSDGALVSTTVAPTTDPATLPSASVVMMTPTTPMATAATPTTTPVTSAAASTTTPTETPTATVSPPTSGEPPRSSASRRPDRTTSTSSTTTTTTTSTFAPIVTISADVKVIAPRQVAAPVRVVIDSIGVDGGVLPTGVNDLGELEVPPDERTLVWYRHGPSPGGRGSAVIAGHLDWLGEPGIFINLASVSAGAHVVVDYSDGSRRTFVVRRVDLVPKPAVRVLGFFDRGGRSTLRLVTCGGEFNDDTNHYLSNVIVTAVPA